MSQVFIGPVTEVQIKARADKQKEREAEQRAIEQDLIIAYLLELLADQAPVQNTGDSPDVVKSI